MPPYSRTRAVFFFSRENQKCPWKPFLPIFSIFFTGGKIVSRALFSVFSRFLHGYTNRFHGQNLSKKLSFSRGKLLKFFHGHRFFSRVEFWRKSSRARFSFHGHFLGKNLVFFTGGFFFFHGKKKKPAEDLLTNINYKWTINNKS